VRRGRAERGTSTFHAYATVCAVVAGWRYTLAVTWVRDKEKPAAVLDRLWEQVKRTKIICKTMLADRYFFTVPVMQWLQKQRLPFIIPVVMRGPQPKRGKTPKGLRAYSGHNAGTYAYTHRSGSQSVDFHLVINYKSGCHRRTKKRTVKKMFFASWKVRLSPTRVRNTYRQRFGIETSYRQLNQSRSRTSSRDPLYRFLLVGLSLFLRNLWQWLVHGLATERRRAKHHQATAPKTVPLRRYQDVLDDFSEHLWTMTQTQHSPSPAS
jgi:putative transposase